MTRGWIYYDREIFQLSRKFYKNCYDAFKDSRNYSLYSLSLYNYYLGLVDLKQGFSDSAKVRLTRIDSLFPQLKPSQQEQVKYRLELFRREILLADNKIHEVIEMSKNVLSLKIHLNPEQLLMNSLPPRDVLARAYVNNNEIDKAITAYEKLLIFDSNNPDRFLIHPRYHYRLAKLYEQKGKREKAIERYQIFLDIWENADPDIPELIDAQNRLATLLIPT
jgi:tetratricopeptide (TPR) repeat protein